MPARSAPRVARDDAAENSLVRLAATLLAMTMVILGAALGHANVPAVGAVMAIVGMLLLLDVGGTFERIAARAPRPRWRHGASWSQSSRRALR